ncbi:two-component regulator propeller domain-containing protein [Reichenbachiella sp. MSK19-1]|uniref:ligand-binding sensor domain-containing protein n=1 Tax=Reichenbachiella sp. MSK19-1 TaxID=1897631 RepID=UPI000E6B6C67|nr:sensor histidine kinase [Reichenbachiella sp. MSK19-1]RJE70688.1 hypothetical protein BGP76_11450 [Reichenbachiella sp. MSK19-1]
MIFKPKHIKYILAIVTMCLSIHYRTIANGTHDNIWFNHLGISQGLSHANVKTILQDSEGYIWIGTFDGLNKYDGYQITTYNNDHYHPKSISSNFITDIIEDRQGYLWVATSYGINRFDKKTGQFDRVMHSTENTNSISNNSVWSLLEDQNGNIWAGTFGGGLNKIENLDQFPDLKITRYQNSPRDSTSLSKDWVMNIYEDQEGSLWIGTVGQYINRYNPTHDHFERIILQDGDQINSSVWDITEDKNGNIWIGTEGGLSKLEKSTQKITNYTYSPDEKNGISQGQIRSLCFDSKNNLWVGSQFGLNLYNPTDDSFSHFKHDDINGLSISSDEAWCIYEDHNGTIWIGTYSGGVSYFHPSYTSFKHITYNPLDQQGIQGNNITSFAQDQDNKLWIAVDHSGLDRYDPATHEYTHYTADINDPNSLSGVSVMEVFIDSHEYVWLGIYNQGLNRLDPKTNEIKKYFASYSDQGKLNNGNVWSIEEDEKGDLWIGTIGGGLNKYIRNEDKFISFGWNYEDPSALSNENIWSIFIENENTLWLATSHGLNRMNRNTGEFKRFLHDESDSTSISNNAIHTIFQDSKDRMWVGTQGGGLNLFNPEKENFSHFAAIDGLANENISSILEDDHGNLWISTNEGISKFDPETRAIRNFSTGLRTNQFNLESCIKTHDGKMHFGGTNGYNSFHPDSIIDSRQNARVAITNFQIFNKTVPLENYTTESSDDIPTIKLTDEQSVFSFEFSSLNYIDPDQVKYAYRLYNFEQDWIETDAKRRFVTYTNITPGEYLLSIKASDSEGQWSDTITKLRVIILPPWYNTWWFKLYVLLAGLTLIYFIYQLRMKLIYNQKRALEEEVKYRTAEVVKQKEELELQAQMLTQYNQDILTKNNLLEDLHRQKDGMIGVVAHDLRAPLNNIKGLIHLVTKSGETNEEQKKYIQLIRRLINQGDLLISDLLYVNGMKQFDIKLKTIEFNLNEFINTWIENYQNDLAKKEQTLVLTNDLQQLEIKSDKDVLTRILDNIFTNAMKFAQPGTSIFLSLQSSDKHFCISIKDQGPGISPEDQKIMFEMFQKLSAKPTAGEGSSGLGLSIVKALVHKLNGEIEVKSELGHGTEFIITFPIQAELT